MDKTFQLPYVHFKAVGKGKQMAMGPMDEYYISATSQGVII